MVQNAANRYNEGAMVSQLDAVYEQGVLRPLEPLSLPEHHRVRLTLEDQSAPQNGTTPPINERAKNFCGLPTSLVRMRVNG